MPELYNLDLDEELLSHLPDPNAWVVLREESFDPELIADDEIQEIFLWQREHLRKHGFPATANVLSDEFDLDLADPETAIGDLITRLRERYVKNQGRRSLKGLGETYQQDPLKLSKKMGEEHRKLGKILNKKGETRGTGDLDLAIDDYYAKTKQGPGASFGFDQLNKVFGGQRGISVILGPPKAWKSWFGINMLIDCAWEGKNVVEFALELPARETDMRLRCMLGNIPWWKYLHNAISRDDWEKIAHGSEELDSRGVYKILHPPHGERDIDEMVHVAKDAGADVIIIDQLQYVEVENQSLGSWEKTGKFWDVLNRARDYTDEIPITFIHQFNRTTINAQEMPDVKAAKGSAAVEETATQCFGIWASKEMRESDFCQLTAYPSRNFSEMSWEVSIDLRKGCKFEIQAEITDA